MDWKLIPRFLASQVPTLMLALTLVTLSARHGRRPAFDGAALLGVTGSTLAVAERKILSLRQNLIDSAGVAGAAGH